MRIGRKPNGKAQQLRGSRDQVPTVLSLDTNQPRLLLKILLATAFFLAAASVSAAEITTPRLPNGQSMQGIMVEGWIAEGDFEKFERLVTQKDNAGVVWLASQGGDISEAMKIGRLVRELKLEVWAPAKSNILFPTIASAQNAVCKGACFFIYAAGVHRRGEVLGVERPDPSRQSRKIGLDQAAYLQTLATQTASSFLKEMGTPTAIAEHLVGLKPGVTTWLKDDEVAALSGDIPEYVDWFTTNCPLTFAADMKNLDREKQHDCRAKLLDKEQRQAKFYWLLRVMQKKK